MYRTLLAAAALIALSAAPVFAGEANSDPFPNELTSGIPTVVPAGQLADTGSAQYPTAAGRPGSNLPQLAGDVLPTNGSQGIVQTANSLPAGFEVGTVAYAQAQSVQQWLLAHNGPTRTTARLAAR